MFKAITRVCVALLLLCVVVAGCSKKQAPATQPAPPPNLSSGIAAPDEDQTTSQSSRVGETPLVGSELIDEDSISARALEDLNRDSPLQPVFYGLDSSEVLRQLEARESLGSTGFGRGVAIPHARVAGINRPVAAFFRLEAPVLFDAADAMPVDLVFGLLSPDQAGTAHLHALAAISRMMRDEHMHTALAEAANAEVLYGLLCNVIDRDAA